MITYSLISQKLADYELFKQALYIIEKNEHLTMDGFTKIIAIKVSINKSSLSDELKEAFPNIIPVNKRLITNKKNTSS